ncbi:hypothetical protein [Candidatus Methanomassiliicoccus intestinalis]|uniref:hypothetical protein n=2 Tax=Candidatus Methanomassiliicoccus intestinalis TaxID=1406512 RepID=UPI0037DD51E3
MNQQLRRIIENVSGDIHSGASEMAVKTLRDILSVENLETVTASEWKEFALGIHHGKPCMAPIFNIANMIMIYNQEGTAAIVKVLKKMLSQEEQSLEMLKKSARSIEGEVFLTTTYSSTVLKMLSEIAKTREIKVIATESAPGKEGRLFANLVAGFANCKLIHDSTVFSVASEADCFLTGADSIIPKGVVNKVGTRTAAEAARVYGLESCVVCSTLKLCPVNLSDMIVSREITGRLEEYNQIFDLSSLNLFQKVITELGTFTPNDILKNISGKVSKELYNE